MDQLIHSLTPSRFIALTHLLNHSLTQNHSHIVLSQDLSSKKPAASPSMFAPVSTERAV